MSDKANEVGALWKSDRPGKIVMTGMIHGEKVVVFANTFKQPGDKKPDFRILKALKQDAPQGSSDDVGF